MSRIAVFASFILTSLFLVFLSSACGGDEENPFGLKSELVTVAEHPVAMEFAPDGRLFYAERRTGNIRVVTADGQLQPDPVANVEVTTGTEWGLTGLALDPDFETNNYLYVYFTAPVATDPSIVKPTVKRFTVRANRGVDAQVIVRNLPNTDPAHSLQTIGSIHFGPDGFMYITVGSYDLPLSQDLSIPQGKMLRLDKEDGSAPPDNPLIDQPEADPRIFAYGFRRPFDFAFHPRSGQIYGSDNTTVSCEELNIIQAGANYGWPDVGEFPYPDCFAGGQEAAIQFLPLEGMEPEQFKSQVAASGMAFVSGDVYSLLGDSLTVCQRVDRVMRRLVLSGTAQSQVVADDVVVRDCQFDIAVSPDGIIHYSNEDEIRRLVPPEPE